MQLKLRSQKARILAALEPEQIDALDTIASNRMKRTGKAVTRTELIREAVALLIEKEGER